MLIMSKEYVAKLNMCSDLLIDKCAFEDGFKDSCSKNFVVFAKKYLWQSLLLKKVQYVESQFFWIECFAKYIS